MRKEKGREKDAVIRHEVIKTESLARNSNKNGSSCIYPSFFFFSVTVKSQGPPRENKSHENTTRGKKRQSVGILKGFSSSSFVSNGEKSESAGSDPF